VGGGDNPHVHPSLDRATHRTEGRLLEHPQEFCLQAAGHLADLVEEQRSAVGGDQQTVTVAVGACVRTATDAEDLTVQQALGDRCAVDRDKRTPTPTAPVVDRTADRLLADAGLALDEDRQVAGGELPEPRFDRRGNPGRPG